MKGSLVILFSLYLAATYLEPVYGIYFYPCPMGCTEPLCTLNVGCPIGKCLPSWCSRSGGSNVGMICLPSCPLGEFCYRGVVNFCSACGVSNCSRCSEWFTCDTCKTGYTLSFDRRQCISLFG